MTDQAKSPHITAPKIILKAATVSYELPGEYPDYRPHENGEVSSRDELVEFAGRMCYQSWANPGRKTNGEYIRHIKEAGHGSVLEHSNVTFAIEGVSRSLTHELVRHRAGFAYSQLSQRYVDENDRQVVEPPLIQRARAYLDGTAGSKDESIQAIRTSCIGLVRQFDSLVEHSHGAYRDMVRHLESLLSCESDPLGLGAIPKTDRRKTARGAARSVLPNCQETRLVVTANCRAWRHFLEMRGSPAADQEIRALAVGLYEKLVMVAPAIFGDYTIVDVPDGTRALTTPYEKV